MKKLLVVMFFVVACASLLKADTGSGALVVLTCGTLQLQFAVGATRSLTINTNGQVCQ